MSASKCDRCGEVVADIDAGFSPGLLAMAHDCGGKWRVRSSPTRYTLVEYIPLQYRDSHAQAERSGGGSGRYPHNGSVRVYVEGATVDERQLDPRWASVIDDNIDEQDMPDGEIRTVLGEPADMLALAGREREWDDE